MKEAGETSDASGSAAARRLSRMVVRTLVRNALIEPDGIGGAKRRMRWFAPFMHAGISTSSVAFGDSFSSTKSLFFIRIAIIGAVPAGTKPSRSTLSYASFSLSTTHIPAIAPASSFAFASAAVPFSSGINIVATVSPWLSWVMRRLARPL